MSIIVRPRSAGVRPPTGHRLLTGHPLANGLLAAFLFSDGPGGIDVVTGNIRLAPSSGTSFGPLGLHALSADHGAELTAPDRVRVGIPHTIAAFFTLRGTPSNFAQIFGLVHNTTDTSPWQCSSLGTNSGGNLQWRGNSAGSAVDRTTSVSSSSMVNVPVMLVATVTGSAVRVWLNGVQKVSGASISAPSYGASSMLTAGDYTGVSRNPNMVLHAGYLWTRELTGGEIVQLTAEPYAMIQSAPYLRNFLMEVAGPPPGSGGTAQMFAVF